MIALRDIESPERGVLLFDKEHRILHANTRAAAIFGVPLSEWVGSELSRAVTHRAMVPEEVIDSWNEPDAVFHRCSAPIYSAGVIVKDNGVGMSPETLDRIFDPFFTTRGVQDTGLGRSMIDAIVIRHAGKVTVESEEGIGTLVTLRFPACG
jgi:signal transduction histidine kinase